MILHSSPEIVSLASSSDAIMPSWLTCTADIIQLLYLLYISGAYGCIPTSMVNWSARRSAWFEPHILYMCWFFLSHDLIHPPHPCERAFLPSSGVWVSRGGLMNMHEERKGDNSSISRLIGENKAPPRFHFCACAQATSLYMGALKWPAFWSNNAAS
jgi:hypothetical protein